MQETELGFLTYSEGSYEHLGQTKGRKPNSLTEVLNLWVMTPFGTLPPTKTILWSGGHHNMRN